MGVAVLVGTSKGLVRLRSEDRRSWDVSPLLNKGWIVTAATRDPSGRFYLGVTHDVWGAAIFSSRDLESWQQIEGAPRYAEGEVGNEGHLRIVGAMDPMGRFKEGGRYVDQIWKLHSYEGGLLAGVSEAGVFRSQDGGKSWAVLPGLNEHPERQSWGPGFGGLCAHSLLTDAADPNRIWVGISAAGVYRSDDGGQTFAAKNDGVSKMEGFCIHSLAHDPSDANRIYRQDHRGMYRSDDGGDSWRSIENGLPMAELSDAHVCAFGFTVAFDPASQSVYSIPLEGDSFRFPHDGKLRVYRTRDGGERWEMLANGLPDGCYENVLRGAMSLDHQDPCGVYFGTTSGSVHLSPDGGESWSEVTRSLPRILSVDAFEL